MGWIPASSECIGIGKNPLFGVNSDVLPDPEGQQWWRGGLFCHQSVNLSRGDPALTIVKLWKLLEALGLRLRPSDRCHRPHSRPPITWITWQLISASSSTWKRASWAWMRPCNKVSSRTSRLFVSTWPRSWRIIESLSIGSQWPWIWGKVGKTGDESLR